MPTVKRIAGQRRLSSLAETCINTAAGFLIALLTQVILFPTVGIAIDWGTHLYISAIFTVVSIGRGYLLRRLFNYLTYRS